VWQADPQRSDLSAPLREYLRKRRFPAELNGYLASLGVRSLSHFLDLHGDGWEYVPPDQPGRLLSVRGPPKHAPPPRILVYPEAKGLLWPGASRLVVGPRLPLYGNSSELLGYPSLYDNAAILFPIYDALRGYPNLASPQCTPRHESEEPQLFLSFVQPAVPPAYEHITKQQAANYMRAHPAVAAKCSASGITTLMNGGQLPPEARDPAVCVRYLRAQVEECAQLHNLSSQTMLNDRTARRHFVLWPGGSMRGHVVRPVPAPYDWLLCDPLPPLTTKLVYDEPTGSGERHQNTLMIPVLTNIRWSAKLDALGLIPPWKSAAAFPEQRTVLMSFIGSPNVEPKVHIINMCNKLNDSICTSLKMDSGSIPSFAESAMRDDLFLAERVVNTIPSVLKRVLEGNHAYDGTLGMTNVLRQTLSLKRRSVFCLEPRGFAPGRPSHAQVHHPCSVRRHPRARGEGETHPKAR
jgi:hypothetical protein